MIELKADLHCHTTFSDGLAAPEECVEKAKALGLDVLAITDHGTAEGALKYWREQPSNGPLVIPGEEISTDSGHILGYFMKRTIKRCSFEEAVAKAREQGALLYAAHLYHLSFQRFIWGTSCRTFHDQELALLDGIELCNGQAATRCNRDLAAFAAAQPEMGLVGGSDAHFLWELGSAWTSLRAAARTIEAVREALIRRRTLAVGPGRMNRMLLRWVYYTYCFYRKIQGDYRRTRRRGGKRSRLGRL